MDATPLLGYINPIAQQVMYMQTPFLMFLFSALEQPEKAHFLCLDEMNLARPEYYFAPFLTAMESPTELHLHQGDESRSRITCSIP
jgi:5-methylcytosine-specific restriction enzyme B